MELSQEPLRRKAIKAYIHSNVFWPQTRASFVIVMLCSLTEEELRQLRDWRAGSLKVDWIVDEIVARANEMHTKHKIRTVLPTVHERAVARELEQSCKVLCRFLEQLLSTVSGPVGVEEFNAPARRLWSWIRAQPFVNGNKAFLEGPREGDIISMRIPPGDHPHLEHFYSALAREFDTGLEKKIIEIVRDEIFHAATAVRAASE